MSHFWQRVLAGDADHMDPPDMPWKWGGGYTYYHFHLTDADREKFPELRGKNGLTIWQVASGTVLASPCVRK